MFLFQLPYVLCHFDTSYETFIDHHDLIVFHNCL